MALGQWQHTPLAVTQALPVTKLPPQEPAPPGLKASSIPGKAARATKPSEMAQSPFFRLPLKGCSGKDALCLTLAFLFPQGFM